MRILLFLYVSLILSACAYSSSSSFADKASLRQEGFSKIVVIASNFSLSDRQSVEISVAEKLSSSGVEGVVGASILPPTQELGSKEIEKRIAFTGADGLLILYEVSKDSVQTYIPPHIISGGSSSTIGSVTGYGGLYSMNSTTTYDPPTIVGGYEISKPIAKYGAALYDLKQNGLRVWIAEIDTRGNALADFSDLANEAGNAVLAQLQKDGVL